MVYLAAPDLSVTVASTVVPFRNSILPVGVPADDETSAVKVTGFPDTEGFIDETSVVVVVALTEVTTCDNVAVLVRKFVSPEYAAVIELVPTASVEVVKLAEPSLNAPVPSTGVPFINVTVSPLGGAPALEVTTAVKVTACP